MKVTIDLDRLWQEGRIDAAEYDRLHRLAARDTAQLAFNLLVGAGVIAVSGAALALLPSPATALALGLALLAGGLVPARRGGERWQPLAAVCLLVGALLLGGGAITWANGAVGAYLLTAAAFAAVAMAARSALLAVLAMLALAAALGARTGYLHATYLLGIEAPALTAATFSVLAAALYRLGHHLPSAYARLALVAARTGVLLVNLGLWAGSLWGARPAGGEPLIPASGFAALWAAVLIVAGAWAWHRRRRWLVNAVAVFAAIHFYTQWFERLGATPGTVLGAGLLALGLALGLRALNGRMGEEAAAGSTRKQQAG